MKEKIGQLLREEFSAKDTAGQIDLMASIDSIAARINDLFAGGRHFERAFTGMHDKNGVPICEGDTLRIYYKGDYVLCSVVYDPRNAAFLLRWPDGYINQYFMNGSSYEVRR